MSNWVEGLLSNRGRRVKVKQNAIVGQDHCSFVWKDCNVIFTIKGIINTKYQLIAPGYGVLGNGGEFYGSGCIFVKQEDVIFVDADTPSLKLVFIAGPYRNENRWEEEQNIRRAENLAAEVARHGHYPVIPHANTRPYFQGVIEDAAALEGTSRLLLACDAVILLKGWGLSAGACSERALAEKHNIPIFEE